MPTSAMPADELKYNLVDKLIAVRDIGLLQKINDLIGNVDGNSPVFKITGPQGQMLLQSEEDIHNGHLISDDDINAEEDEWLKE